MTTNYPWLKDQTRYQEVVDWLGGRWDINQLELWSRGRFSLDELKTWIGGKYPIDDVVTWRYHESDPSAELVKTVVDHYRPGIEQHQGSIAFLGIDGKGNVHIAFDGACGSCSQREIATTEQLKKDIAKYVPGVRDLINDGPARNSIGNFAVEDYSSIVQIRPRGIDRTPPAC